MYGRLGCRVRHLTLLVDLSTQLLLLHRHFLKTHLQKYTRSEKAHRAATLAFLQTKKRNSSSNGQAKKRYFETVLKLPAS